MGRPDPPRCPDRDRQAGAAGHALYRLAEADRSINLRVFTGLSLERPRYRNTLEQRFVAPLLDRLFASYPDLAYAKALRAGARSIIAVRRTRPQQARPTSNIVWRYANTTVPRHLRDIVATEYGIADLPGKSDRDCVAAMLAVTDSRFQPLLRRKAQRAGQAGGAERA